MDYTQKYLKYKNKYEQLLASMEGGATQPAADAIKSAKDYIKDTMGPEIETKKFSEVKTKLEELKKAIEDIDIDDFKATAGAAGVPGSELVTERAGMITRLEKLIEKVGGCEDDKDELYLVHPTLYTTPSVIVPGYNFLDAVQIVAEPSTPYWFF